MINDKGIIPILTMISYKGELVFYRECLPKHFMIKYLGVGLSIKKIKHITPTKKIIIKYIGKTNKYYLTTIGRFQESNKKHLNAGVDLQHFVSFKDMEQIEVNKNE